MLIFVFVIILAMVIYIGFKYRETLCNKYQYYRERPAEDPAIAGYLYNRDVDVFALILSEILVLVQKGYIEMTYEKNQYNNNDYFFKNKCVSNSELTKLKSYELAAYRALFKDGVEEVSLTEWSKNIKKENSEAKSARVSYYVMEQAIKEYINEKIRKRKTLLKKKKTNRIPIIRIIFIIVCVFASIGINLEVIYKIMQFILFVSSVALAVNRLHRYMTKYTDYGVEVINQAHGYARHVKDYGMFEKRDIVHVVTWEDVYIYAIAFNIPIKGIKEFISDEVMWREDMALAKIMLKVIIYFVIIGFIYFVQIKFNMHAEESFESTFYIATFLLLGEISKRVKKW